MNIKKLLIAGLATLSLSPVAASFGSTTAQVVHADTVSNIQQNGTVSFTNEELFEVLEANGYNVKSIIGEEEYKNALVQDMLRRGGTYISTNKHGFTLYLNSAVCKVIFWGGTGAAAAVIGTLLAGVLGPAGISAVQGVISGVMGIAGSKATERGIYIRFSNKGNLVSWGYQ